VGVKRQAGKRDALHTQTHTIKYVLSISKTSIVPETINVLSKRGHTVYSSISISITPIVNQMINVLPTYLVFLENLTGS